MKLPTSADGDPIINDNFNVVLTSYMALWPFLKLIIYAEEEDCSAIKKFWIANGTNRAHSFGFHFSSFRAVDKSERQSSRKKWLVILFEFLVFFFKKDCNIKERKTLWCG